jgi:pimeloyl-ACP methyl ester carboxylesterase
MALEIRRRFRGSKVITGVRKVSGASICGTNALASAAKRSWRGKPVDRAQFETGRRFISPVWRISYAERGSGPSVLFTRFQWSGCGAKNNLSSLRRRIALDLMGHGLTEVGSGQDKTSVGQAQGWSNSWMPLASRSRYRANDSGTCVTQVFAVENRDRVRTLALANGDVHDNWPPRDLSGFLDIAAGGPRSSRQSARFRARWQFPRKPK